MNDSASKSRPVGASPWPWPIALAFITLVGLISALLSDGIWDAVSWFGLGIPIVVCVWFGWIRRR